MTRALRSLFLEHRAAQLVLQSTKVCVDARGAPGRRFRWYSRGAIQFDIWVTASASPAAALPAALEAYVAATGRPSPFPHWTTGFWQSKNRCKF